MTIAFLDEQMTKRDQLRTGAPSVRGAHTPRRRSSVRVAVPGPASTPVSLRPGTTEWPTPIRPSRDVAPGDRDARHAGELRLTARGRVVFGVLLVLIALVVFSLGRFSAGANASGPPQRVTVQAGDTLWSIAQHAAPTADPRVEIDRIVSANHLVGGGSLTPGTVLLVPMG